MPRARRRAWLSAACHSSPPLVAIPVEPEVLEWFKSQGGEYEQRMTAALHLYAEAHQRPRPHSVAA